MRQVWCGGHLLLKKLSRLTGACLTLVLDKLGLLKKLSRLRTISKLPVRCNGTYVVMFKVVTKAKIKHNQILKNDEKYMK